MSLDGKLLYKAKTALDEMRRENEVQLSRRQAEAYAKNPKIREIDAKLRSSIPNVLAFAFSSGRDAYEAADRVRDENLSLQSELRRELLTAGLPEDYLDERYMCPKCGDTGYDGTSICSCLMARYKEEQRRSLSALLKLGEETFEAFDLDWYDKDPDPKTGDSPRQIMEFVRDTCYSYAQKFGIGKNSHNLFLRGGTGLGKTFLSACIAKVVSERGFSVVYETASGLFTRLEEDKFSKSDDVEEVKSDVMRYFACDLLIIDDLGTEMTTAFTISALYNLMNNRQVTGKKTIMSSNLSAEELRRRYSQQIVSRLEGEYQVLPFRGRDIRIQKKALF
ncbi:MAG: ATP-binding protein [Oscillospiraceae bacterium]